MAVLEQEPEALATGLDLPDRVRRGRPGPELARLRHGAGRQLAAADAPGKAEVVLDPPRAAGLAAEARALQNQRREPLRGAVYRRRQSGGTASDDREVDLLD